MSNDVIDALHQLAAASKQAGGKMFTNQNRNIITDGNKEEDDNMENRELWPVATNNQYDNAEPMAIGHQKEKDWKKKKSLKETGQMNDMAFKQYLQKKNNWNWHKPTIN